MNIDPAITSLLRYGSNHQSFALLFRCERSAVPEIEVIIGEEQHLNSLQSLADLSAIADGGDGQQTLLVAPYRQIAERGYAVN